jgi:hypothetical protein
MSSFIFVGFDIFGREKSACLFKALMELMSKPYIYIYIYSGSKPIIISKFGEANVPTAFLGGN